MLFLIVYCLMGIGYTVLIEYVFRDKNKEHRQGIDDSVVGGGIICDAMIWPILLALMFVLISSDVVGGIFNQEEDDE